MSLRLSSGAPVSASRALLWYDVKYILEVDFANDVVAMKDAYLQYQGVKIGDTPLILPRRQFQNA